MRSPTLSSLNTAAALREAFDNTFTLAQVTHAEAPIDFLQIRVGGDPYALRLVDLDALHADRVVVPVASSFGGLLGLAAFRGVIAPVYDLGVLLGYSRGLGNRWVVLVKAGTPIAFCFEQFDGHLRVQPHDLLIAEQAMETSAFVRGSVRADQQIRPVLHLPALVGAIATRVKARATHAVEEY